MDIANFGVEEWLNHWEKKAVYDIAQSSIEALTLEELIELDGTSVKDFFEQRRQISLDYGWIEGSTEFKERVAALYNKVEPQNILQTNGATGANLLVLYALIKPGDHVVSMLPTYQQLYDIPKSLGANVDFIQLKEEENWQFDVEKLAAAVKPETKLICLNSANNPTGTLLDRRTLEQVVVIAKKIKAYVLVDEVYAPLTDTGDFVSIADLYDKGIATNSLSKTYSIPGIRIGWIAANEELTENFRKYRDYTMICGGVLSDELAVHVLKNKEKILDRNKAIISENLTLLKKWAASESKVALVAPNYVSTSFIKLAIEGEDTQFCVELLEETGVLLVPGSAFGLPKHARLGYCCKKEVLEKGLTLLSSFLAKY
ncbi:aminotransferase [Enterococcus ratti]|uniref:Aminotransferase n=1 Tax=Enterococcus ratti TaxID=150033 RepID=A0A1L8W8R0_9ENTE|nr:aminotransferase [Enterococcus ratti]OJG77430.1 aspartate aminotransferase [Enterococcus ratti]